MPMPESTTGAEAPRRFRAYLGWSAAALAAAALAVTALVVLVDPYHLYRVVDKAGFNAVKPGLTRHQESIKVAQALALQPRMLILGNSRAEIGFNPATLAALPGGAPAYNLAVPGTGLASSRLELRRLLDGGLKPSTLILGVEFLDFIGPAARVEKAASALPALAPARWTDQMAWRFDTVFSLASVKDAARTLMIQRDPEAVIHHADGFNPLLEYRAHARREGYHLLFAQAADAAQKRLRPKLPAALQKDDFLQLRALLDDAAAAGAEVRLLIYPYHANMMDMFEEKGLAPLFQQWKAGLVDEVDRARAARPGQRVSLVDFSGYGPHQCEPVPGPGERSLKTRWYWEAGHFKEELGALVLARVMAPPSAPDGFGSDLERSSLAATPDRIALERAQCRAAHEK